MQPNTVVLGFPGDEFKQVEETPDNNVFYSPQTSKKSVWDKFTTKLSQPFVDPEDPNASLKYDLEKFSKLDDNDTPISANEYCKIIKDIVKCKKNFIIARQ
jgi:hypothetical protein